MTRNESPPTRTGVPVHLDTGPSSIAWWGSTWLLLCNKDGTTSPIAENDGERRKKIHHLTTVELATFFLLAFHLEFFLKRKKKGAIIIFILKLNQSRKNKQTRRMIDPWKERGVERGKRGTHFTSTGRRCRHRLQFFRPVRGRTIRFDSRSRRKRPLQCTADATRSFVSCGIHAASPVYTPDTASIQTWKKQSLQFNGK